MKNILTIAGFDPSNGAGITKDIDIFQSCGFHGISIPSCMVIQGPKGVSSVYPVSVKEFSNMLDIAGELEIDAVKLGVLFDAIYIDKVSGFVKAYKKDIPVVLDPVFQSKNRTMLLSKKGIKRLKETLLPIVTVITPNIEEAEVLTGIDITGIKSMEKAARSLHNMGVNAVIVKGGHIKGEPVDVLFDGRGVVQYKRRRIKREIHGTGCVFSSLLTAYLCHGYPLSEAFIESEEQLNTILNESYKIASSGFYYMSPCITKSVESERWTVINEIRQAASELKKLNPIECVPEVQMNIGFAVKNAKGIEDIAAFPGRISVHDGRIYFKGEPCFGASNHVARLILVMMRYHPYMRACANIRYNEGFIKIAEKKGMSVVFYDRKDEPDEIKKMEGKSLDYLLEKVLSGIKTPPDIVYDKGDTGKEPIIRLFARDPLELIKKMEMIRL